MAWHKRRKQHNACKKRYKRRINDWCQFFLTEPTFTDKISIKLGSGKELARWWEVVMS